MELQVHYEEKPCYEIVIETDPNRLPEKLGAMAIKNRKLCIVTDSNVGPLYAREIQALLAPYAKEVIVHTFSAGEENKNLNTVSDLYHDLIEHKFERSDMLLALGGGVTGDLTGYAAATYLRGIDFVQLPTSLLSQVDSSIGGKTGVDFDCYKNMVGAFYQPKLVYMNLATLKTLPEREYLSGMGEIIKHALIKDREYYQWLQANLSAIKERELSVLEEMICRSCEIKRAVVEQDPKEKGERALLNFGHTLGHAIETLKVDTYKKELALGSKEASLLLHGECVALGMLASMQISKERGWIDSTLCQSVEKMLLDLELLITTSGITPEAVIQASKNDKKMEDGKVKFILLHGCGEACIDRTVTEAEMKTALDSILEESF